MLSQAAFNAFLKTLEEPPHMPCYSCYTEKHKIIQLFYHAVRYLILSA